MTEHESIKTLLALAAAGALGPEELRRVEQHARECDLCRRDLETWSAYAQVLRKLPQPSAPEGLVERTRARILHQRAEAAERRRLELFLAALAAFGWASGWAFWSATQSLTGLALNGWAWSAVSMFLTCTTAGAAALMLGRSRDMRRLL